MLLEMRLLGKGLGAHLALMRPFSRVDLLVPLKVGFAAEAFVAFGTNVGGAVSEQMLLQMAALREGLLAHGAFVRSIAGVNLFVALKIRLIAETFVARGASKWRILRLGSFTTPSSSSTAAAAATGGFDGVATTAKAATAAAAASGSRG